MQKQLKITINGKHYAIATDEDDNDVYYAAQLVDSLLKSKTEKLPAGSEDKAALIVALQLATDLSKAQRELKSVEQKAEQLLMLLGKEA